MISESEDLMTEYAVVDPVDDRRIASYDTVTDSVLEEILTAAAGGARDWGCSAALSRRVEAVRRVGLLHEAHKHSLAALVSQEMGKPLTQAVEEVEFSAAIYAYYADHAADFLADEHIAVLDGSGAAVIRRQPLGALLGIMPWNYPFYQVARFAAPNLVAGNTIVLKHAPQCPQSAAAIESMMRDAGVPVCAYQNVYASHDQVSRLIADSRVRGVSFTGSGRGGSAVAAQAGRHLKKVVLELGGSDPFIVLSTHDLTACVEDAVAGRMDNAGQACNAAKRFIVLDAIYDDFVTALIVRLAQMEPGSPRAEGTELGPLSSAAAASRLAEQLDSAIAHGATLALGGGRVGNAFTPTVLTGVDPENPAHHEEFFGPVAVVYRVRDEEEAITLANDTPYGLGGYVYTIDPQQAMRVADRLEAGMVFVNGVGAEGVELPFGGVKASGFGRELGRAGIEEFVNHKLIRVVG